MLSYEYVARDPSTGQKIKSVVEAENEKAAAKIIQKQGLAPIEISPAGERFALLSDLKNRVRTKDKILFTRQLSTLINAGLPLVQGLRSVAEQTEGKSFRVVINRVISDVEGGAALADSMAKHPKVFNQVYISLVAAGEASGTLDSALERLAMQQEKDAEIMSKVRGAMVYPIIVLLVMLAVVGFMIIKVLPQVEVLYAGMPGAQLPFITVALLAISHATVKYWWAVIIIMAGLSFGASRWFATLGGRRFADKFKMKAWPIGPLFMKLYMARFARTGTTLIASGVPLLQVLEITANAVNNVHVAGSIRGAITKVKGGRALSESLKGDPNFLTLVPDMLKIGEQSGAIEQMMERVAEYYEKEVDNQIKTVSTIIEPVMMIILGVLAFIIVAAVLLPVYGLAGKSVIS